MADNNILNSVSSWVIQIKKELDAQIKSEIAGIESKYGLTSSRTKDRAFNKLQNLNTYYQAMLDRGEYLGSDQITRAKADLKLDPMPADERKVMHQEIAKMDHLKTESKGEGKNRYMTISYVD